MAKKQIEVLVCDRCKPAQQHEQQRAGRSVDYQCARCGIDLCWSHVIKLWGDDTGMERDFYTFACRVCAMAAFPPRKENL